MFRNWEGIPCSRIVIRLQLRADGRHQANGHHGHQLRFSTEHHMRVSIIGPGWGSVNQSQFTHHPLRIWLLFLRRERRIFNNRGVVLILIIHWLESPLFYCVILTKIEVRGLLKAGSEARTGDRSIWLASQVVKAEKVEMIIR